MYADMFDKLETERLSIRTLKEEDAPFILELLNTETWLRFIGERQVHSAEAAIHYIRNINADPNYNCGVFQLKETGIPLGIVTFIYRKAYDYPDIGYAQLPQFEGNGYAFEAVKHCLDETFARYIAEKVLAVTRPDNVKSLRLLKRLGMSEEPALSGGESPVLVYAVSAPA